LVKDHKPNFVKAPKRCFEKTEGYYSDQEGDDDAGESVTELEGQSDSANMEEGDKSQEDEEEENQDEESRKEAEKSMDTDDNLRKRDGGHNTVVDSFKKVTRAEWSKMTYKEKKKYLKERRMWKNRNTVFIKDDSDNEQLTDDEKEEDLQFSEDSEDEKEKDERLATEALKSYADKFEPQQHPEDYKLVMRADVVEAELADVEESTYETLEDIERRDRIEKLEQKEKERKEKMREERLKRIQAFQAAAHLKERSDEEDDEDEEDEVVEEQEPVENPFYSSYKEAVENEEELEDPLKEAREREKRKLEEDADALKRLEEERLAQERRVNEPPQKKARTSSESEGSKFSGVGAVAEMLAEEKERIRQELAQEEERVRRKEAEKVLRKGKRRGDPNNPTKEEVEAAQELEALTWQDRYVMNKKVAAVVSSSKMISKVREKQKMEKQLNKTQSKESQPSGSQGGVGEVPKSKVEALPGMIGSLEEYASLVGTTVGKLQESRYVPPEVSDSEDEESDEGVPGEGDLWGAIMGPSTTKYHKPE